jgi:hypothetical protein
LKKNLYSECTLFPSFGKAGARRTTVDEEDDEEDEPPPLEGEDLTGCVADCASAVMRERVEAVTPMTGRKGTRRRSRVPRMSVSHGTTSDESSNEEESVQNLKGPGNICVPMSVLR